MKKTLFFALLIASLSCLAQTSSFTYQGRLNDGGAAATGSYDFQFSLRDAANAGNQIAGTVTNAAVVVSNGLFTVTLDFGATVFEGSARYLEIGVRTNGNTGTFSMLAPRQQVTSAPYAIQSANAAVATTAASVTGAISDSQLSSNIPRLNGSATFGGGVTATSFNGNGAGLTNLPAANLTGTLHDTQLSANVPLLNGSPIFSGTVTANTFSGSGVSLTSLNAATLSSGTLPDARLSANVALLSSSPIFTGTVSGLGFSGSGAGLTSLSASQLSSGSVPDARLSANVALLSGSPTFSGTVAATSFSGSGSGLNNLNAGNISTGTIPGAQIGGTYGNAVTFNNAGNSFTGNGTGLINVNAAALNGMGSTAFWYRAGNGGTSAGTDFIGTTDNQPLEFKVNGQRALRLEPNASGAPNVIGGARFNQVDVGIVGATISGGGATNYVGNGFTNRVSADFGVIGGGAQNAIQASAPYSTIGGGGSNLIQTNASGSTIGGGYANAILTTASYSTIAGGVFNTVQPGAFDSIISGGIQNTIQTNAFASAIGGGQGNTIRTNSYESTIGGGQGNTIQANASSSTIGGGYVNAIQAGGYYSTIGGGYVNTILTNAFYSTIGGGYYNTNGGQYAVIPGGSQNFAGGNHSFAAGTRAKANHDGALVWADFNNFDFPSLATNSFSVRSIGGARFVSGIDAGGNPTAGVTLAADGTAWASISDRNAKKNFQPLDKKEVLEKLAAIPVQHWNYKWEENSTVPHIGPMAQDFKSAFYPGRDDKSITTLEFDGIELAAIQGLHQIMKEKDAKISELEVRVSALEHLVSSLAERK